MASKKFSRLCSLTADQIDVNKVSNNVVRKVLNEVIDKRGEFVFSKGKGHTDIKKHEDSPPVNQNCHWGDGEYIHQESGHYDWKDHEDHKDHNDYTEDKHTDNRYSEASYHTDSSGGHEDYTESTHHDQ